MKKKSKNKGSFELLKQNIINIYHSLFRWPLRNERSSFQASVSDLIEEHVQNNTVHKEKGKCSKTS